MDRSKILVKMIKNVTKECIYAGDLNDLLRNLTKLVGMDFLNHRCDIENVALVFVLHTENVEQERRSYEHFVKLTRYKLEEENGQFAMFSFEGLCRFMTVYNSQHPAEKIYLSNNIVVIGREAYALLIQF